MEDRFGYTQMTVNSLTDKCRKRLEKWHDLLKRYREQGSDEYYIRTKDHIRGYTASLFDMGVITERGKRLLDIYYTL